MGGCNSVKLKILYLLKILQEESDEEHELTMPQLTEKLAKLGIEAERKSIKRDLIAVCDFGYDISLYEDNKGYYLRERDFDLSEFRFLIDAVLASRCITPKDFNDIFIKTIDLNKEFKEIYKRLRGVSELV